MTEISTIVEFQFHKGTIKTLCCCFLTQVVHYFNSIKVRLKLLDTILTIMVAKFQFHKGTIKTQVWLSMLSSILLFQFHKGTIKTNLRGWFLISDTNFNSIKVRLKR